MDGVLAILPGADERKVIPPELINQEMEATLLGAVLSIPKTANEASFLRAEDFAFDLHRIIWAEIQRRMTAGESVDALSLSNSLKPELAEHGGLTFLNRLMRLCIAMPTVGAWANEIRGLSIRRQVNAILIERQESIAETEGTPEEAIADIMADLERVTSQAVKRVRSAHETRHSEVQGMKNPVVCYSTGFNCLDEAMGGGLHAGKAYGIFARMKSGKTLIASQIAHHLNRSGIKSLFVAGEMGAAEIEHRAMADEMGVNALTFIDNRYRSNPNFVSTAGELAIKTPNNLLYLDAPGLTLENLRRDVTHAILAHGIKGFFLDYLQLVQGQRKGQSKAEHLDDICQWIAEVTRKRNVFAMVLGQMNQEGNTRGGEGVRLAFDQVYELRRQADPANGAWFEMLVTRYTKWAVVGSDTTPALFLNQKIGPRFEEGQVAA